MAEGDFKMSSEGELNSKVADMREAIEGAASDIKASRKSFQTLQGDALHKVREAYGASVPACCELIRELQAFVDVIDPGRCSRELAPCERVS